MRRLSIAICAALSIGLGGCDLTTGVSLNPFQSVANPVSRTTLYQAETVFDGAVKTFNALKRLCADKALPSSCRGYVVKGQGLIVKAYAADKAARNFVDKNPTLDATNVIQAFTGIVSDFNSTVATLGATRS